MRKIIRKTGTGLGIYINKEDAVAFDIKEGDIVDITINKIKRTQ